MKKDVDTKLSINFSVTPADDISGAVAKTRVEINATVFGANIKDEQVFDGPVQAIDACRAALEMTFQSYIRFLTGVSMGQLLEKAGVDVEEISQKLAAKALVDKVNMETSRPPTSDDVTKN